jgi:hypothetical protein
VRTIHIGIRHDDHFVITQFFQIKVWSRVGSQGCDDRSELIVGQNLVQSGFLHVEHLPPKRKDGLKIPIPAHFG